MTFFLIMYIYAGALARGDSVSLVSVPMPSMAVCEREGRRGEELVRGSSKDYRFVCIKAQ